MKLGWNIAAGFINSAWSAIVILLTVPFLLKYLGLPAYGLIGFFAGMQALFSLFDMGLGPTINREVARETGSRDRTTVRDLLHTLALGYWAIAGLIAVAVVLVGPWISRHWLNASTLPPGEVAAAVTLMGFVIACRFPLSLYLGTLMGAGRMVTASGIEIVMVTAANVGAVLVVAFIDPSIRAFFIWQTVVGVLNVVVVRAAAWRAVADATTPRKPRIDLAGLRRIWRFTAGMGFVAVLGVGFTQADKIVLSKIVSLEALGRYMVAALIARGLYVIILPVFAAIYPRMTALHAVGDEVAVERLYRSGTRLMMAVIFPAAFFLGVFSTDIATVWTGNADLARSIHVVVELLLLGTAFNAAMHFPYALQLAYGRPTLTAAINLGLMLVYAPVLVVFSAWFGIVGAAAAWAVYNVLYAFVGTWATHRWILPGGGASWLLFDLGIPMIMALVVAGLGGWETQQFGLPIAGRLILGGLLAGASPLATIIVSPALSRDLRDLWATGLQAIEFPDTTEF